MTIEMVGYVVLVGYLVVVNGIAFVAYGKDKHKAQTDHFRTPERRLMAWAWCGGALGAWLGMRYFRHKTKHWRFRIGVPLALVVWFLLFCYITAELVERSVWTSI